MDFAYVQRYKFVHMGSILIYMSIYIYSKTTDGDRWFCYPYTYRDIWASGGGRAMEFVGSYLSVECRILACHHEFGRKSQEVSPEKPKMCLKSSRVTVLSGNINLKIGKSEPQCQN